MAKASTKRPSSSAEKASDKTLVIFLLDRSGSMQGILETAIQSFNNLLTRLQASTADIRLSLIQFDTAPTGGMDLHTLYSGKRVASIEPLTAAEFIPRGMTPLCDAIATTIHAVEESLQGRTPKIVMAIQTDGRENASHRFSWSQVRDLIGAKRAQGWEFQFLGAGLESNAYEQSSHMGIPAESTVVYNKHDKAASLRAFGATGDNIRAFAEGTMASTAYSAEQKIESGDASVVEPAAPSDRKGVYDALLNPAFMGAPPVSVGGHHGMVSGMWAPRAPVVKVEPALPLRPADVPAQTGPVVPVHIPQPLATPHFVQGLGFDPMRGVVGTPSDVLAPPRTGQPFVLDVFGDKGGVR